MWFVTTLALENKRMSKCAKIFASTTANFQPLVTFRFCNEMLQKTSKNLEKAL